MKIGKNGSQIPGSFDCRTGGNLNADTHFIGQYVRQCGLSQTRRAVK